MADSEINKVLIPQIEFAEEVWHLCRKASKDFVSNMQSKLAQTSIQLDADRKGLLVEECLILHMWIISKTLVHEKHLLDAIHDCFFNWGSSYNMTPETLELLRAKLEERYKRYYAAWDDNAGGGQFIFGGEVLQCLLNSGRPNPELLDAFISFDVVMSVLSFMKCVAKARLQYEIIGRN